MKIFQLLQSLLHEIYTRTRYDRKCSICHKTIKFCYGMFNAFSFFFCLLYLSVGSGLNKQISNRITQLYNITMTHAILLGGQNALAWKPSSGMLCHNGLCVWQLGCVTGFANTCPGLAPALYTLPAGCNGSDMYYILYRHTQLAARVFPLCTKIIW